MKVVKVYLKNFNNYAIITNFLAFFLFYLKMFPYEYESMRIQIHSPADSLPDCSVPLTFRVGDLIVY